jgi:hypothetical protein
MNAASPKQPRLDPQTRLLSRFYEPLVLLYTLGRTRGERTCPTMTPREDLAHLPLTDLRRMFLDELAYMCDYDKGGETVTALGLEFTPERCIFWVATNAGAKAKIIDFLVSLLTKIMQVSAVSNTADITANVASQCISFEPQGLKNTEAIYNPYYDDAFYILPRLK